MCKKTESESNTKNALSDKQKQQSDECFVSPLPSPNWHARLRNTIKTVLLQALSWKWAELDTTWGASSSNLWGLHETATYAASCRFVRKTLIVLKSYSDQSQICSTVPNECNNKIFWKPQPQKRNDWIHDAVRLSLSTNILWTKMGQSICTFGIAGEKFQSE